MAYVIDKLLVVSELLPYSTCDLLLLLTITKMLYYIFLKITNPNWEVGAVGIERKSQVLCKLLLQLLNMLCGTQLMMSTQSL